MAKLKDVQKAIHFKDAFQEYRRFISSDSTKIEDRLLLFYAVECGLKYLAMRDSGAPFYNKLKLEDGHDFSVIIKKITTVKFNSVPEKHFRLVSTNAPHYKFSELHQAWRYRIEVEEFEESLRWLQTAFHKLNKSIKELE